MQIFILSGGKTDIHTMTGNNVLGGVLDWKSFSDVLDCYAIFL